MYHYRADVDIFSFDRMYNQGLKMPKSVKQSDLFFVFSKDKNYYYIRVYV